jgi:hypothetical protein
MTAAAAKDDMIAFFIFFPLAEAIHLLLHCSMQMWCAAQFIKSEIFSSPIRIPHRLGGMRPTAMPAATPYRKKAGPAFAGQP